MTTLAATIRSMQLRLDQLERNTLSFRAVEWQPEVQFDGDPETPTLPEGFYIPANDLVMGWFSIALDATPAFTGGLQIVLPIAPDNRFGYPLAMIGQWYSSAGGAGIANGYLALDEALWPGRAYFPTWTGAYIDDGYVSTFGPVTFTGQFAYKRYARPS